MNSQQINLHNRDEYNCGHVALLLQHDGHGALRTFWTAAPISYPSPCIQSKMRVAYKRPSAERSLSAFAFPPSHFIPVIIISQAQPAENTKPNMPTRDPPGHPATCMIEVVMHWNKPIHNDLNPYGNR